MKYLTTEELRTIIPSAYRIEIAETIECLRSTAVTLRHDKSGARVALFINDDENKLFSVAFSTPPEDDCGTPHIIEHSVLCGSEKYPVKDPFMQLVKTSMQTFLNAMTYSDKTVYPVSSCNDKDFINLSNIYLDAVFSPNISRNREIFMQEGWHYEPLEDGSLSIGGVVYSEMLGAISSPDSNIYDELICTLFPDNAYGKSSGGDPDSIPSLTYEGFLDYYKRHYHPSNCYITLYGNMDFTERLTYIDEGYLSKFDATDEVYSVGEQPLFGKGDLKRERKTYPVSAEEGTDGKAFFAYGSLCANAEDVIDCMAYGYLSDVLVESPGAPIKNALIGAGIGSEVYGGFLNHMKTPVFSVIAKDTDEADADRFLEIVMDTLKAISKNGVSKKSLLSVIERSEFHFREGEQGGTPKGLNASLSMLQNWLYSDSDPFGYLKVDEILQKLRELCETDYYERLIDRIIDSEHAAMLILAPEVGLNEKKAADLKDQLERFKSSLADAEYDAICDDYDRFTEYQDREESEEELSCIPMLSIDDISKNAAPIFVREGNVNGYPVVYHDVATNGITYARLMFDISHVPNEDLVYLDILTASMGKINTASHKYEDLLDDIRLNTGGFGFSCEMYRKSGGNGEFSPKLEINIRVLDSKLATAVSIAGEIIRETDLGDTCRIRELLSETVSERQRDIISAGSEFAAARALSYFSSADASEDYLDGISAYFKEKELLESFENEKDNISQKLRELVRTVFTRKNCLISIAADSEKIDGAVNILVDFLDTLEVGEDTSPAERLPLGKLNEAFMTSSKVQYVAAAGNLYNVGYGYRGEYQILASILKNDLLYPEIRMKGGAYGYSCSFSVNSGNVCMFTYRDPCLKESIDVFNSSGGFIRALDMSSSELSGHVIGSFGRIDRPTSAYMKVSRSIAAYMSGRTYEDISRDREAMLNVDVDALRSLGDSVERALSQNYICVIGNEEKILENKELFLNVVRLS